MSENVFVKLQIEKSQHSGGLILTINFDINAPNFSIDKDIITWSPTFDELDFVMDTFEIISKKRNQENTCEEEIKDVSHHLPLDNKKEESSGESSERKIATFKPLNGDFGATRDSSDFFSDKKADEKEVFVQVDGKTIDEALKRKGVELKKKSVGVGEALILDEEDKNIIDKMLKKREKNKDTT